MKIFWIMLFVIAASPLAKAVDLAWDETIEADSYAVYRCDMDAQGEWTGLYPIAVLLLTDVIVVPDPDNPPLNTVHWTDTTDDDGLSHCWQVYSVLEGVSSVVGSNFATNILPGDVAPLVYPVPPENLLVQ